MQVVVEQPHQQQEQQQEQDQKQKQEQEQKLARKLPQAPGWALFPRRVIGWAQRPQSLPAMPGRRVRTPQAGSVCWLAAGAAAVALALLAQGE